MRHRGAPNTVVDANAAQYYRTLVGGSQQAIVSALLAAGVTPSECPDRSSVRCSARIPATVQTTLRLFRPPSGRQPERRASSRCSRSDVEDVERLKATTTDAYELGYKGILGKRARLAIDLWYQRKTNFTTAAQNVTPNAFFDPATLGAHSGAALAAQAQAGRVPAAAVTPLVDGAYDAARAGADWHGRTRQLDSPTRRACSSAIATLTRRSTISGVDLALRLPAHRPRSRSSARTRG